jgi:hypothetical protein
MTGDNVIVIWFFVTWVLLGLKWCESRRWRRMAIARNAELEIERMMHRTTQRLLWEAIVEDQSRQSRRVFHPYRGVSN